ncbi:MAG: hypothetical protein ACK4MF_09790 [Hyphomicrobiaceae bacterium]
MIALLLAGFAGGCSARSQYPAANVGAAEHHQVAVAAPREELEDDGLPVQRPPLLERRRLPDDPSEPFSPNYGSAPPRQADMRRPPTLPDDLPTAFRRRLVVTAGAD